VTTVDRKELSEKMTSAAECGGPRALLINGTVGAGKTSVADAIGDLLAQAEIPNAVIDLDWLRRSWPPVAGDRFNLGMTLRNLRSVAGNYLDAGATRLVVAGVVESHDERRRYLDTLGIDLFVCRLKVDLAVVRERLIGRHGGQAALRSGDPTLTWHLNRAGELDDILEAAGVEDCVVPASDGTVVEVAAAVLAAAGWR
jgi:hypothetical protein